MQSIEEALEQQWHNVETNIAQIYEESEKQDSLGKSVMVYDNENKESHSNLDRLESLGLIRIGVKDSGVEFRIVNIIQCLQHSSWSEIHDMP